MIKVQFGHQIDFMNVIKLFIDDKKFDYSMRNESNFEYQNCDLIVPLTIRDYPLLRNNYPDSKIFLIPDAKTVQLCHNKHKFNDFLIDSSFGEFVPTIYSSQVDYPFIYKFCRGGGGMKCRVINNQTELESYENEFGTEKTYRQQFIEGDNEYSFHSIAVNGEMFYHTSRKFSFPQKTFVKGGAFTTYKSEVFENNPYVSLFRSIIKKLNYSGTSCIDFKIKDGMPLIMEMNPRFGSSLSLTINTYLIELHKVLQGIKN